MPKSEKPTHKGGKRIKIQQIASGAGKLAAQIATLKGLGLGKIGRIADLEDTQAVRGMVRKVSHLVKVIE